MKVQIAAMIMLFLVVSVSKLKADETAFCVDALQGLEKSSITNKVSSISPALSDAYALQIYVTFPDVSGQDELPDFYADIEANIQDFFEEMSYDAHHRSSEYSH